MTCFRQPQLNAQMICGRQPLLNASGHELVSVQAKHKGASASVLHARPITHSFLTLCKKQPCIHSGRPHLQLCSMCYCRHQQLATRQSSPVVLEVGKGKEE
jgi:hypothetical protein